MLYQLSYSRPERWKLAPAPGSVKRGDHYSMLSVYACVALASLLRGLDTSTA